MVEEAVHVRGSRLLLLVAICGLAAALIVGGVVVPQRAEANRAQASRSARAALVARTLQAIDEARGETWRWQRVMSTPPTLYVGSAEHSSSLGYQRRVLALWQKRAVEAQRQALHPARLKAWLCIHSYEGSWSDPNPPYYGGLQMDYTFQQAYGRELLRRKGTADNWTLLEQIWVAERAYRSGRGFYPWPNTARYCGLI